MRTRRRVVGILALGLIAIALGLYGLPGLARRVAIARLQTITGRPVSIDGLWALQPGNGTEGGTDEVLFTAGPQDESHGLLGSLSVSD